MLKLLILVIVASVVNCQRNCRNEWSNQKQCINRDRNQFTATSQMSEQDRSDMKRKLVQCYQGERCGNPFASDDVDKRRRNCFQQVKSRFVQDMQSCIRRKFSDYDMPTGDSGDKDWGQYIIQMKKAKCQPQDKKRFGNCMSNAMQRVRTNGRGQQQQQKKPDPCEVRYQCYQRGMTQPCYDRQDQVKKELCVCASSLNIESYKSDYSSCMRSNVNVATDNDFNYASFDKIKDKYCKQIKDPCGGYNGRQALGRNNANNQNQPHNNNGGFQRGNNGQNTNSNGNWQGGHGGNFPQGGNNGNFQGGNNGNFQGGNNGNFQGGNGGNFPQGGSSGTGFNGNSEDFSSGNYDFSSVGGDDDGFPAIGNVINSGGGTGGGGITDLSSVISSANTGFDPFSFIGGGDATGGAPGGGLGSGLFSSFTGNGGGLGGGALGGGLGNFDISSIFGGKKK